jgi:hypothetical protein
MTNALQRPTLVLNRNWQAINVATVARALIMLWNESAKVIDLAPYLIGPIYIFTVWRQQTLLLHFLRYWNAEQLGRSHLSKL